jgi:cyclopropane fatty-acyl-phospholipid synthase-like methyltransferase
MKKDYFEEKSKIYESDSKRVDNVKNIADGMLEKLSFSKEDSVLDFGSGTGLLTEHISPFVKKIIVNDVSDAMNDKIQEKINNNRFPCEIEIDGTNICEEDMDVSLDGIISSMTVHHVQDVKALFEKFYAMLKPNGILAIADLETEDGTFHKEDTGVFHFGFEKEAFLQYAKEAGFVNLDIHTVSIAHKPYGEYPIFLLTGNK